MKGCEEDLLLDESGHPQAVVGVQGLVDLVEQVKRGWVAPTA